MAITTTAAILGGAAIAGTAYGASKAASAAKKSARLQAEANDRALDFQRETRDLIRRDNALPMTVRDSSLRTLSGIMGLDLGGATPGALMTGGGYNAGAKATGGSAGVSPMAASTGGAPSGVQPNWAANPSGVSQDTFGATGQATQAAAPDWNAYLANNPDVAAQAAREGRDPVEYAQNHYQVFGQNEGRELPMAGQEVAEAAPATPWVDPTSPGGYMVAPRPTPAARPTGFTYSGPDLSIDAFRASPDYEFRVREMEKGLGNLMSARGGVFSGQRMKAALERRNNLADAEFTDWRNFTQAKANADRAFDYGVNRDTTRDYEVDRARDDGLYDDDRRYTTGRYDTRNQTLLNLAGFGSQASAQNASAAQSFANNAGALMTDSARARGDAATASADAWNRGLGGLMSTGAYLIGSGAFGGGGASFPKTYNI